MKRLISHPYTALTLVALFWGANAVAGGLAVGHVSPMLLTLLRWTMASLFMAPFALGDVKREWPTLRANVLRLLGLGVMGFTAFNAALYLALNYTSAINVTIEQAAMPLVVFLANFLLFRTRVVAAQLFGFALTLTGVLITAFHGDLTRLLGLALNRGDALMMLAVLLYASYTVALRLKPRLHWRTTIFALSVSAALLAVPFAIGEYLIGATIVPDGLGVGAVLYTAIFPSLIAQSLYIRGVEQIGPNRANLFINFVPIFGAILAVGVLGETLHAYHLMAIVLVLGGITLAERGAMAALAKTKSA